MATRGTIARGDSQKNLVVAPIKVMADSWEKTLHEEGELFIPAYGGSSEYKRRAINAVMEADHERRIWVLMNPEGFRGVPEVAKLRWGSVLADESVYLKNPQAQVSKIFAQEFERTKYRAILCGLPSPESDLDLFQQFKFLHGRFMGERNYYGFREKYFEISVNGFDWVPKKGVHDEIKQILHQKASVLRRVDVGMEKEKIHVIRRVTMNADQARLYRQVEKEFAWEHGDVREETVWATEKDIYQSRIAGGFTPDGQTCISTAKPDEIIYLLSNELRGEPTVIWYKFKSELLHDLNYFRSRGFTCSAIHGLPMLLPHRQRNREDWQRGKSQLLLVMEKAADKGNDFSRASVSIYRSNEASADLRAQSEDRILSVVKNDSLLYIDLVCEGTNDEESLQKSLGKVWNAREMVTTFAEGKRRNKDVFLDIIREAQSKPKQTPCNYDPSNPDTYDPFAD